MGRRRFSLLVGGVAVALSSLSACGDDASHRTAPEQNQLRKGDQYVAIGDSYTSAPLNGPSTHRARCLQTATNYPHQVSRRLGLKLTDVSCGGDTTEDVMAAQLLPGNRRSPQINAVSSTTDLVTISLGANDFDTFGGVVFACTWIRAKDPAGAPCTAANAKGGENSIEHRTARIERRLIRVIQLVKERAPAARIVVVGYPHFFPSAGPCIELPIADGDFPFMYRVNKLLVQAQKNAAQKSNVDYVDVFSATKGHDMCADEPWIAGREPTRSDAMFYHPYPEEQGVVADLLVEHLD